MKFVFIVQGEGRGHMTQAIAFSKMIEESGNQLAAVILGKSKRRLVPEFFTREIIAPIHCLESPNFETDKGEKGILIGKTISSNLKKLPVFWRSLTQIHKIIQDEKPDVILNFYDLLGGYYSVIFQPKAAYWVIGHQYLSYHPDFIFASSKGFQKQLFLFNTWMTSWGADERFALSFRPNEAMTNSKVRIVPPLLRREVKELTPTKGDFYLAYMVNCGYGEEVISYAQANPKLKIKAYWDKKDAAEIENPLPNLSIHRVHDRKFLQDMADCKGLVCTAGFESICEAMYLGKPVMVIPVAGQYEQACNALDAVSSGAGISSENFDFSKLKRIDVTDSCKSENYTHWVNSWQSIFRELISDVIVPISESGTTISNESMPSMG